MPGLLGSILSIGGAVIGGAVGGPGGAAIGSSIGGAVGGAIDQSGSSNAAYEAQLEAQREAIQARQYAASKVGSLENPYLQSGYTALNALTARLGLPTGAVTSATPGPGNPLAYNPGQPGTVSASLGQSYGSTNALNRTATIPGVAGAAPTAAPGPVTGNALTGSPSPLSSVTTDPSATAPAGTAPGATGTGAVDPASAAAGVTSSPAVGAVSPGTFGNTANPTEPGTYQGPAPFSYTLDDYKASPAYAWQVDQANKDTLANAAVTGATQSGAAAKALQDRAQNLAYTDFTNERAFANGLYQQGVNNALNTYNTQYGAYANDRNYLTGQFNTETNNLFNLSNAGQQAATVDANAAVGAGSGIANSQGIIGNAGAANALTQGQIGSNLATGIVAPVTQAVGNYFGGAGSPMNLQSYSAPNLSVAAGPGTISNQNFISMPNIGF